MKKPDPFVALIQMLLDQRRELRAMQEQIRDLRAYAERLDRITSSLDYVHNRLGRLEDRDE